MRRSLAVAALAGLSLHTGCATVRPRPAEVMIECDAADARVYVDDRLAGRAVDSLRAPLQVAAGSRRIEVRAEARFAAYRLVTLLPGQRATLAIPLPPDLDRLTDERATRPKEGPPR